MNQESDIRLVADLEIALGLKEGFFRALLDADSDWTFVIQLHALFEAATAQLLSTSIAQGFACAAPKGHPVADISKIFGWLEMSNHRTGKVAFVKAMSFFPPEFTRYLSALSELRNHFAHDIRHIGTTLQTYLAGRDINQKKAFVADFGFGIRESVAVGGTSYSRDEFILKFPRLALWLSASICIDEIAAARNYFNGATGIAAQREDLEGRRKDLINRMATMLQRLCGDISGGTTGT